MQSFVKWARLELLALSGDLGFLRNERRIGFAGNGPTPRTSSTGRLFLIGKHNILSYLQGGV
jgi:hypothetical protein